MFGKARGLITAAIVIYRCCYAAPEESAAPPPPPKPIAPARHVHKHHRPRERLVWVPGHWERRGDDPWARVPD